MKTILITGSTGNVGREVLKGLSVLNHDYKINAGVKDLNDDHALLKEYHVGLIHFDFTDPGSYHHALNRCDVLFLLRPPQISDVEKYFKPLIQIAKDRNVGRIVFLSVQGVEHSKIIPHHKIEKLIVNSRIPYTFLRPAYFMQNFTTTLLSDIQNNNIIYLPAGNARFTLVDVGDVGAVAAKVLTDPQNHNNKSYELTNNESLTFGEMAEKISAVLEKNIKFVSPNLIEIFWHKRKERMPPMLILVMIMLHYFPRFSKAPQTTKFVKIITGKDPTAFKDFISANKHRFNN